MLSWSSTGMVSLVDDAAPRPAGGGCASCDVTAVVLPSAPELLPGGST